MTHQADVRHKPKVLVFLPSNNEVQRFVHGGAFDRLAADVDLSYAVDAAELERMAQMIRERDPSSVIHPVALDEERQKAWFQLFRAACFRFAARSRSFALRSNVAYAGEKGKMLLASQARNTQKALRKKPVPDAELGKRKVDLVQMFDPATYARFRALVLAMPPLDTIRTLLETVKPALVVLPSSLHDRFCNEVLHAVEPGTKAMVLQSGWDNLSSKGLLQHNVDYMGVWGPQSVEHAVLIQDVRYGSVVQLGAPHYEPLLAPDPQRRVRLREALGLLPEQKLVLFGGSFRQFDETLALKRLDELIEAQNLGVKILYRPHPYRLDRIEEDNFFEMTWRHVVFDEEMKGRYLRSKAEKGFIKREQPIYSMDYLAGVLSSVDAVMSPMSTLILEAMIVGRPTLALAFSDEKSATYDAGVASEMTHFDPLRDREDAILWCAEGARLPEFLHRLVARIGDDETAGRAQKDLLRHIVMLEPGSYADRLAAFCAGLKGLWDASPPLSAPAPDGGPVNAPALAASGR